MDTITNRELAELIAVNCVRNTVIEDFHNDGKLSQDDMKRFNIEVTNKLYTFLEFWSGGRSPEDAGLFMDMMLQNLPQTWDEPFPDSSFMEALKMRKERLQAGKT